MRGESSYAFISTGINKFGDEYVVCKREEGEGGGERRGAERGGRERREEERGGERRGEEEREEEVRAPVPSFLLVSISLVMNMWYVREERREVRGKEGRGGREVRREERYERRYQGSWDENEG